MKTKNMLPDKANNQHLAEASHIRPSSNGWVIGQEESSKKNIPDERIPRNEKGHSRTLSTPEIKMSRKTNEYLQSVFSASDISSGFATARKQVTFVKPNKQSRMRSTSTPNIKHDMVKDRMSRTQDGSVSPSKLILPALDSSLTVISLSRSSTPYDRDEDWETPRSARSRSTTPLGRSSSGKWASSRRNPLSMVRLDPLKSSDKLDDSVVVSSVTSTPRKRVGILADHLVFGDPLSAIEENLHEHSINSFNKISPVFNDQRQPSNFNNSPKAGKKLFNGVTNSFQLLGNMENISKEHETATSFSPPLVDFVTNGFANSDRKVLTFENLLNVSSSINNQNNSSNQTANNHMNNDESSSTEKKLETKPVEVKQIKQLPTQIEKSSLKPEKLSKKSDNPENNCKTSAEMIFGENSPNKSSKEPEKVHETIDMKNSVRTEDKVKTNNDKVEMLNSPKVNRSLVKTQVEFSSTKSDLKEPTVSTKEPKNVFIEHKQKDSVNESGEKQSSKYPSNRPQVLFKNKEDKKTPKPVKEHTVSPVGKDVSDLQLNKEKKNPQVLTDLTFKKAVEELNGLRDEIKLNGLKNKINQPEENKAEPYDRPKSLTLHVSEQDEAVKITVNLNENEIKPAADGERSPGLSPSIPKSVGKKGSKPIKGKMSNNNGKYVSKLVDQNKTGKNGKRELPVRQGELKRKGKIISLRNLPLQKAKPSSTTVKKRDNNILEHKQDHTLIDSSKENGVGLHQTVDCTQPSNNVDKEHIKPGITKKETSSKVDKIAKDVHSFKSKNISLSSISTPIIQEAYPSKDSELLLKHVADRKATKIFPRKVKTADSRIKSGNKSASGKFKGQTKSGKKKLGEGPHGNITKPRAKSAGLAVEKREKGKIMDKHIDNLVPELSPSPKLDDTEALISGKSWHVVVSKNESENVLVKDQILLEVPLPNQVPDEISAPRFNKLSPIPESQTNSWKSSQSLANGTQDIPTPNALQITQIAPPSNILTDVEEQVNDDELKIQELEDIGGNMVEPVLSLSNSTYSNHVRNLLELEVWTSDAGSDKTLTDGELSSASEDDELEMYQKRLMQPRSEMDAHVLTKYSDSESEDDGSSTLKSTSGPPDIIESNSEPTMHAKDRKAVVADDQISLIDCSIEKPVNNSMAKLQRESLMEAFSEDDSEMEMLEHMRKTLQNGLDDDENISSESECSIHLENDGEDLKSQTPKLSRQLTMSALKKHDEIMIDEANDLRKNVESRASETTEESFLTNTTVSVAQLNTDKCMGWKKGPLIDQGAFGKVWQGMTHGGQLIAVKQVELSISRSEAQKEFESLQREVDILKDMKHPNIVNFIGTCLEGNVVSIFMEFLTGGSISSILRNFGALQEAVFKRYTRQILEGVTFLHLHSVVHRDINGNNIMLLPNGIIKLIDFGCAKRVHQQSAASSTRSSVSSSGNDRQLRSVVGTPFWMAPEVVNGEGHGPKSDVWSLGCTVMEMATTRPPLHDMGSIAAMFHIGKGRPMPELPKTFSKHARSFVKKCMQVDTSQRPTSEQLLQHRFIQGRQDRSTSNKKETS